MAQPRFVPTLYQETRLSPSPASPSSILHISCKDKSGTSIFGAGRKRPFDEVGGLDEESYARKHLASEGSVFFRRKTRSPRSFLWRVLDNRQLLEIQCVDLVQEKKHAKAESLLTYQVAFPTAIMNHGVTFSDPEETDALEIFALTSANELYTITLKKDLLIRTSPPADFDPSSCIKKHVLSSLSFRRPYRFVAVSSKELLLSLHDGGLMKLERDVQNHNAQWKETYFSEGGWGGTLRGLISIKRHQTVRYGDLDLEPNSATAISQSPDGRHIWTVTLDHELTVWSTRSGKVVARRDLIGERQDKDTQKRQVLYTMPAEQGDLLKIVEIPRRSQDDEIARTDRLEPYAAIVYSPKEHAFKIYGCMARSTDDEDETPHMKDLLEGGKLSPPFGELLNTNLWHLEEFHFRPGIGWLDNQLWVRVRSGAMSKVFNLKFDLFDNDELAEELQDIWARGWTLVDQSHLSPEKLKAHADALALGHEGSTSPTEQWMQFLSYPGRFTNASMETALSMYRKRRKLPSSTGRTSGFSEQSLKERLSNAISSKIAFHRLSDDQIDIKRYNADIQAQWSGFYSMLLDLHKQRSDWLSLAFDHEDELAWTVRSDFVAPVRRNDKLELLALNAHIDLDDEEFDRVDESVTNQIFETDEDWEMAQLIAAARNFTSSLSSGFIQSFSTAAIQDSLRVEDVEDTLQQAQAFFEKTDISAEVNDSIYNTLEEALKPLRGIGSLNNNAFIAILERLDSPAASRGQDSGRALNRYGGKTTISTAQQFIQETERILLDLLALVTFFVKDLEEDNLDPGFNATQLYDAIMSILRNTELRHWMARQVCLEPSGGEFIVTTVSECLFIGDWDAHAPKELALPERLTFWSWQWTFAAYNNWLGFTANVFATLLRRQLYDLANDFDRFLKDNPWTQYLRARLQLVQGEYELAALGFHEAAEGLSRRMKGELDTAGLLTPDEVAYLGSGQDQYFTHIADLFERLKVYSYTADFATLAMHHIDESSIDKKLAVLDGRKSITDSPVEQVADARQELRLLKTLNAWDEIVGRLFNALVQTGRYHEAYAALLRIKRPDMKRSNLQKLVDACVNQEEIKSLLDLPLTGEFADATDTILLNLAKKTLALGTSYRPHHQTLYAFRTRRGNYRGAAAILHEVLERLKHSEAKRVQDPEDETLLQAYLLLINTLACCGEGEEWLLTEPIQGVHAGDRKRRLVTLEDVRREYAAELDRRSDLLHGRFPLVGADDDAMDVL